MHLLSCLFTYVFIFWLLLIDYKLYMSRNIFSFNLVCIKYPQNLIVSRTYKMLNNQFLNNVQSAIFKSIWILSKIICHIIQLFLYSSWVTVFYYPKFLKWIKYLFQMYTEKFWWRKLSSVPYVQNFPFNINNLAFDITAAHSLPYPIVPVTDITLMKILYFL